MMKHCIMAHPSNKNKSECWSACVCVISLQDKGIFWMAAGVFLPLP